MDENEERILRRMDFRLHAHTIVIAALLGEVRDPARALMTVNRLAQALEATLLAESRAQDPLAELDQHLQPFRAALSR